MRPSLQYALDAITGGPALVRNGRMDIIAANLLGRALYVDAYATQTPPVNIARYAFLTRQNSELSTLTGTSPPIRSSAILRAEAGRDPHDQDLQDLIGSCPR